MPLISLFSNNLPDFFIVERTGVADIAKIETDPDRRNATFEWTAPISDSAKRDGCGEPLSERLRAAHRHLRRFPHTRQVLQRDHGPRRRRGGSRGIDFRPQKGVIDPTSTHFVP